MKNPLRWSLDKVSASLERDLSPYETFPKRERKHKKKKPLSLERVLLKVTGASRLPASRRLVIGTYLAIMIFLALVFLEGLSIVFLHEFNYQLLSGIGTVITFIAGTYFGRHV